jgi:energy-converting hydrogenase B subunit D
MTLLQILALALVAVGAPAVVLSRDPLRQAMVVGVYGFALAVLFFLFQAPDVALSEIVVASVGLPVMILLAAAKVREHEQEEKEQER